MDELVNVLVQIYRGIVGPGMSTYMEAFPVMPSSAHQVQHTPRPTPPPMTGAVVATGAHAATIAAPSGSQPVLTGSSGVYAGASVAMPRKSKAGLIVAILAVLAVGGGVAAFVVVGGGNKPGPGPGSGSGSGSQIASNPGSGSQEHPGSGATTQPRDGSGRDGSGSGRAGDGSAAKAGSNQAGSDSGSNHDANGSGSDSGSNTPPPVEVVKVPLFARNGIAFEVWENGAKLFEGPDNLEVPVGEKRMVVIKARGFKDKTLVVDTKKKKVQFSLDRIPGPGPGPGHVTPPGPGSGSAAPPPGPNCANAIVDPKNKACVAQYCAIHPDEDKCGLL
jgi:hypothetical protein